MKLQTIASGAGPCGGASARPGQDGEGPHEGAPMQECKDMMAMKKDGMKKDEATMKKRRPATT
jgi:hypothetical protein